MDYVDVDGDAERRSTPRRATLTLPAGATVTLGRALLGRRHERAARAARPPRRGQRATSCASRSAPAPTDGHRRARRRADLDRAPRATRLRQRHRLVPAGGAGTYTVANVQAGTGDDRYAGWSLVVAYQDATQERPAGQRLRRPRPVVATHTFSTDIPPFFTPASGTVTRSRPASRTRATRASSARRRPSTAPR